MRTRSQAKKLETIAELEDSIVSDADLTNTIKNSLAARYLNKSKTKKPENLDAPDEAPKMIKEYMKKALANVKKESEEMRKLPQSIKSDPKALKQLEFLRAIEEQMKPKVTSEVQRSKELEKQRKKERDERV